MFNYGISDWIIVLTVREFAGTREGKFNIYAPLPSCELFTVQDNQQHPKYPNIAARVQQWNKTDKSKELDCCFWAFLYKKNNWK